MSITIIIITILIDIMDTITVTGHIVTVTGITIRQSWHGAASKERRLEEIGKETVASKNRRWPAVSRDVEMCRKNSYYKRAPWWQAE